MNRIRSAFALGLIGALALAACGSDEEDGDTTVASTAVARRRARTTPAPRRTRRHHAGPRRTRRPVTVTVGSADFPESQLLAEIYAQTLEANNVRVARKDPIGSRELYYQAIVNNEIQLVPEYTNSLLSYVLRQDDPDAHARRRRTSRSRSPRSARRCPTRSSSARRRRPRTRTSSSAAQRSPRSTSLATLSDLAAGRR